MPARKALWPFRPTPSSGWIEFVGWLPLLLILCFLQGCDSTSPVESRDPNAGPLDNIPLEVNGPPVAFVDVSVVPMDVEQVIEHQTVLVRNGVIEVIGSVDSVTVDANAVVVPGEGTRYLMPGLADMHVHINDSFTEVRNDHILFLANGVTTIRTMWGLDNRLSLVERDAIEAGVRLGPRIYAASPGMDGSPGPWNSLTPPVESGDQARQLVRQYVNEGYDFIKVYSNLSLNVYDAILDEAHKQGIPAVGHVPWEVGLQHTLESGQVTMEHLYGFGIAASSNSRIDGELDWTTVREMAMRSRDAGAWHVPTMTIFSLTPADMLEIETRPSFRYIGPVLRSRFATWKNQGRDPVQTEAIGRNQSAILKILIEVGGNILLGCDTGISRVLPGFAVHDELDHLVDAGLTPYEALRTGTVNPAIFLSNDAGVVAPGRRADLMLLNDNPLTDVTHVRNRRAGVMVRGRWLSAKRLQQMLNDIHAMYAGMN